MTLTYIDFFCGAGGSSTGAKAVPGVKPVLAANHWDKAIASHTANFPDADHFLGDLHDADVAKFPAGDIFWASPECPKWSNARGKKRDFDKQPDLFGDTLPDEATDRSRALMWDVPRYLEAMAARGRPVLAGVVENVIDVRAWDLWQAWVQDIRDLGYATRLIALNSMHARPRITAAAPQSRDRLYLAYWRRDLGRTPDWDKWLRPQAWCPGCEKVVRAVQVFKKRGADMGRYRQQYLYRCPHVTCRNTVIEPPVLPAAAIIDWSLPGRRIGDGKPNRKTFTPYAPATQDRIRAGLAKYAVPMLAPAGGTWRDEATPVTAPAPTRTTRENDGLAVPPLLIPAEGRDGKVAAPTTEPLRTQTARNETGLAWMPFIAELRGGSSDARPVLEALATVTASGNHHGLATAPGNPGPDWASLLLPYYGHSTARPVSEPIGALTTRDRYALVKGDQVPVEEVLFRMLEPGEIGAAMAFPTAYTVLGNKREKVRLFGNAVTPPVAEVIVSALVEAITGHDLPTGSGS
ncbi:DNA cytosine methyltransferase [Kitasatospora herbaricolor]|uniref:DNA cytosine methyltransferase n=1 Tax=Kitasatospora herbaricolor TaxID=68217 RepID=UPI00174AD6D7|nr:DNA cytosine methyltransferase [Kitasatospora herbaricolor]MDQ0307970.1 DNA (cytosine-5)-methyltransferase 1 [Kitasatospora herbaricolor]GGV39564.1 DNA cytosine methyltransferase [Kitasatospora herbaricolor]